MNLDVYAPLLTKEQLKQYAEQEARNERARQDWYGWQKDREEHARARRRWERRATFVTVAIIGGLFVTYAALLALWVRR
jgi:hypothetical protein